MTPLANISQVISGEQNTITIPIEALCTIPGPLASNNEPQNFVTLTFTPEKTS